MASGRKERKKGRDGKEGSRQLPGPRPNKCKSKSIYGSVRLPPSSPQPGTSESRHLMSGWPGLARLVRSSNHPSDSDGIQKPAAASSLSSVDVRLQQGRVHCFPPVQERRDLLSCGQWSCLSCWVEHRGPRLVSVCSFWMQSDDTQTRFIVIFPQRDANASPGNHEGILMSTVDLKVKMIRVWLIRLVSSRLDSLWRCGVGLPLGLPHPDR